MDFKEIFQQISPEEIPGNAFAMAGKELYLISAGKGPRFNSMVGSGGGWGVLFQKPSSWCIVRSDRYTLDIIQQERTYTLAYFGPEHREAMMFLGSKSGRDSEKMKETTLTAIQTPQGGMAFEEARLILQCTLTQMSAIGPEDFYSEETKALIKEANREENTHRNYVFGEITGAWIQKKS